MSIQPPDGAAGWLVEALFKAFGTGSWPKMDEDHVRQLGRACQEMCNGMREAANSLAVEPNTIKKHWHGPSSRAFIASFELQRANIDNQAQYFDSLAQICMQTAKQVEETKLHMINQLVVTAAALVASYTVFPGLGELLSDPIAQALGKALPQIADGLAPRIAAQVPAQLAERNAFKAAAGKLGAEMLVGGLDGAFFMTTPDLLTQLETGHWDPGRLGRDLATGLVSGPLGVGVGRPLTHALSKVGKPLEERALKRQLEHPETILGGSGKLSYAARDLVYRWPVAVVHGSIVGASTMPMASDVTNGMINTFHDGQSWGSHNNLGAQYRDGAGQGAWAGVMSKMASPTHTMGALGVGAKHLVMGDGMAGARDGMATYALDHGLVHPDPAPLQHHSGLLDGAPGETPQHGDMADSRTYGSGEATVVASTLGTRGNAPSTEHASANGTTSRSGTGGVADRPATPETSRTADQPGETNTHPAAKDQGPSNAVGVRKTAGDPPVEQKPSETGKPESAKGEGAGNDSGARNGSENADRGKPSSTDASGGEKPTASAEKPRAANAGAPAQQHARPASPFDDSTRTETAPPRNEPSPTGRPEPDSAGTRIGEQDGAVLHPETSDGSHPASDGSGATPGSHAGSDPYRPEQVGRTLGDKRLTEIYQGLSPDAQAGLRHIHESNNRDAAATLADLAALNERGGDLERALAKAGSDTPNLRSRFARWLADTTGIGGKFFDAQARREEYVQKRIAELEYAIRHAKDRVDETVEALAEAGKTGKVALGESIRRKLAGAGPDERGAQQWRQVLDNAERKLREMRLSPDKASLIDYAKVAREVHAIFKRVESARTELGLRAGTRFGEVRALIDQAAHLVSAGGDGLDEAHRLAAEAERLLENHADDKYVRWLRMALERAARDQGAVEAAVALKKAAKLADQHLPDEGGNQEIIVQLPGLGEVRVFDNLSGILHGAGSLEMNIRVEGPLSDRELGKLLHDVVRKLQGAVLDPAHRDARGNPAPVRIRLTGKVPAHLVTILKAMIARHPATGLPLTEPATGELYHPQVTVDDPTDYFPQDQQLTELYHQLDSPEAQARFLDLFERSDRDPEVMKAAVDRLVRVGDDGKSIQDALDQYHRNPWGSAESSPGRLTRAGRMVGSWYTDQPSKHDPQRLASEIAAIAEATPRIVAVIDGAIARAEAIAAQNPDTGGVEDWREALQETRQALLVDQTVPPRDPVTAFHGHVSEIVRVLEAMDRAPDAGPADGRSEITIEGEQFPEGLHGHRIDVETGPLPAERPILDGPLDRNAEYELIGAAAHALRSAALHPDGAPDVWGVDGLTAGVRDVIESLPVVHPITGEPVLDEGTGLPRHITIDGDVLPPRTERPGPGETAGESRVGRELLAIEAPREASESTAPAAAEPPVPSAERSARPADEPSAENPAPREAEHGEEGEPFRRSSHTEDDCVEVAVVPGDEWRSATDRPTQQGKPSGGEVERSPEAGRSYLRARDARAEAEGNLARWRERLVRIEHWMLDVEAEAHELSQALRTIKGPARRRTETRLGWSAQKLERALRGRERALAEVSAAEAQVGERVRVEQELLVRLELAEAEAADRPHLPEDGTEQARRHARAVDDAVVELGRAHLDQAEFEQQRERAERRVMEALEAFFKALQIGGVDESGLDGDVQLARLGEALAEMGTRPDLDGEVERFSERIVAVRALRDARRAVLAQQSLVDRAEAEAGSDAPDVVRDQLVAHRRELPRLQEIAAEHELRYRFGLPSPDLVQELRDLIESGAFEARAVDAQFRVDMWEALLEDLRARRAEIDRRIAEIENDPRYLRAQENLRHRQLEAGELDNRLPERRQELLAAGESPDEVADQLAAEMKPALAALAQAREHHSEAGGQLLRDLKDQKLDLVADENRVETQLAEDRRRFDWADSAIAAVEHDEAAYQAAERIAGLDRDPAADSAELDAERGRLDEHRAALGEASTLRQFVQQGTSETDLTADVLAVLQPAGPAQQAERFLALVQLPRPSDEDPASRLDESYPPPGLGYGRHLDKTGVFVSGPAMLGNLIAWMQAKGDPQKIATVLAILFPIVGGTHSEARALTRGEEVGGRGFIKENVRKIREKLEATESEGADHLHEEAVGFWHDLGKDVLEQDIRNDAAYQVATGGLTEKVEQIRRIQTEIGFERAWVPETLEEALNTSYMPLIQRALAYLTHDLDSLQVVIRHHEEQLAALRVPAATGREWAQRRHDELQVAVHRLQATADQLIRAREQGESRFEEARQHAQVADRRARERAAERQAGPVVPQRTKTQPAQRTTWLRFVRKIRGLYLGPGRTSLSHAISRRTDDLDYARSIRMGWGYLLWALLGLGTVFASAKAGLPLRVTVDVWKQVLAPYTGNLLFKLTLRRFITHWQSERAAQAEQLRVEEVLFDLAYARVVEVEIWKLCEKGIDEPTAERLAKERLPRADFEQKWRAEAKSKFADQVREELARLFEQAQKGDDRRTREFGEQVLTAWRQDLDRQMDALLLALSQMDDGQALGGVPAVNLGEQVVPPEAGQWLPPRVRGELEEVLSSGESEQWSPHAILTAFVNAAANIPAGSSTIPPFPALSIAALGGFNLVKLGFSGSLMVPVWIVELRKNQITAQMDARHLSALMESAERQAKKGNAERLPDWMLPGDAALTAVQHGANLRRRKDLLAQMNHLRLRAHQQQELRDWAEVVRILGERGLTGPLLVQLMEDLFGVLGEDLEQTSPGLALPVRRERDFDERMAEHARRIEAVMHEQLDSPTAKKAIRTLRQRMPMVALGFAAASLGIEGWAAIAPYAGTLMVLAVSIVLFGDRVIRDAVTVQAQQEFLLALLQETARDIIDERVRRSAEGFLEGIGRIELSALQDRGQRLDEQANAAVLDTMVALAGGADQPHPVAPPPAGRLAGRRVTAQLRTALEAQRSAAERARNEGRVDDPAWRDEFPELLGNATDALDRLEGVVSARPDRPRGASDMRNLILWRERLDRALDELDRFADEHGLPLLDRDGGAPRVVTGNGGGVPHPHDLAELGARIGRAVHAIEGIDTPRARGLVDDLVEELPGVVMLDASAVATQLGLRGVTLLWPHLADPETEVIRWGGRILVRAGDLDDVAERIMNLLHREREPLPDEPAAAAGRIVEAEVEALRLAGADTPEYLAQLQEIRDHVRRLAELDAIEGAEESLRFDLIGQAATVEAELSFATRNYRGPNDETAVAVQALDPLHPHALARTGWTGAVSQRGAVLAKYRQATPGNLGQLTSAHRLLARAQLMELDALALDHVVFHLAEAIAHDLQDGGVPGVDLSDPNLAAELAEQAGLATSVEDYRDRMHQVVHLRVVGQFAQSYAQAQAEQYPAEYGDIPVLAVPYEFRPLWLGAADTHDSGVPEHTLREIFRRARENPGSPDPELLRGTPFGSFDGHRPAGLGEPLGVVPDSWPEAIQLANVRYLALGSSARSEEPAETLRLLDANLEFLLTKEAELPQEPAHPLPSAAEQARARLNDHAARKAARARRALQTGLREWDNANAELVQVEKWQAEAAHGHVTLIEAMGELVLRNLGASTLTGQLARAIDLVDGGITELAGQERALRTRMAEIETRITESRVAIARADDEREQARGDLNVSLHLRDQLALLNDWLESHHELDQPTLSEERARALSGRLTAAELLLRVYSADEPPGVAPRAADRLPVDQVAFGELSRGDRMVVERLVKMAATLSPAKIVEKGARQSRGFENTGHSAVGKAVADALDAVGPEHAGELDDVSKAPKEGSAGVVVDPFAPGIDSGPMPGKSWQGPDRPVPGSRHEAEGTDRSAGGGGVPGTVKRRFGAPVAAAGVVLGAAIGSVPSRADAAPSQGARPAAAVLRSGQGNRVEPISPEKFTVKVDMSLRGTANRVGARLGVPAVSLAEVADAATRKAGSLEDHRDVVSGVKGLVGGFAFDKADENSSWPSQGITTSGDAQTGGADLGGRKIVAVTSYWKNQSRWTVFNWGGGPGGTTTYSHIRFVKPTADRGFTEVESHAGGGVLYGSWLFVADSAVPGFRVYDTRLIYPSHKDGFDYVMPQVGFVKLDGGFLRVSTVSLDHSTSPHRLVMAEYANTKQGPESDAPDSGNRVHPRVVAFELDPKTGLPKPQAVAALRTNIQRVQGIAANHDRLYFSSSNGSRPGKLHTWDPATGKVTATGWPIGPESLSFWTGEPDMVWTVTEHEGQRVVIAKRLSTTTQIPPRATPAPTTRPARPSSPSSLPLGTAGIAAGLVAAAAGGVMAYRRRKTPGSGNRRGESAATSDQPDSEPGDPEPAEPRPEAGGLAPAVRYAGGPIRVISARPEPGLTGLIHRHMESGAGIAGTDGLATTALPDGRMVLVCSDSPLAGVGTMVHNALLVQEGTGLRAVLGGTPEAPADLVASAEPDQWYWSGAPHVGPDALYVYYQKFSRTGQEVLDCAFSGSVIARFSLSDLSRLGPVLEVPGPPGVMVGVWMLKDGNYTYVYGVEDLRGEKYLHIARFRGVDPRIGWEFRTADGWSTEPGDSVYVQPGVATEFSVTKHGDCYLLTTMDTSVPFSEQNAVVAYVGDSPVGPFTDKTLLYRVPEQGRDENIVAYSAKVVPALSSANEITIIYSVNSLKLSDLVRDPGIYRPRAAKVCIAGGTPPRRSGHAAHVPLPDGKAGHPVNGQVVDPFWPGPDPGSTPRKPGLPPNLVPGPVHETRGVEREVDGPAPPKGRVCRR